MTILFTIPSLEIGGAEIFLARLCSHLAEHSTHTILVLDFEQHKRDPRVVSQFSKKVQLLSAPTLPPFSQRVFEKAALLLGKESDAFISGIYQSYFKKIISSFKIDLIHSHLHRSDRIVSRLKVSIPRISTLHGCYNFYTGTQIDTVFKQLSVFNKLIYITERNLQPFLNTPYEAALRAKSVLIYNGIALKSASPAIDAALTPLRLVVVSRCIREKGWEILIKAVQVLNLESTLVQLTCVGDGDFLRELKLRYGHLHYVNFEGMQTDPIPFIAEAHVCCFPSFYANESLPNSILEYQLQGKPILSANLGDIAEMMTLDGKVCGYLAPKNCSEEELQNFFQDKIKSYLYDRTLLAEHGQIALHCVKRFDLNISAERYVQVYNELVPHAAH